MGTVSEFSNMAIKAFDNGDLPLFEKYSKIIFNHFNVSPSSLLNEENCYLVGIVYSYLEGALRDFDDPHRVCFENACYCFSTTIKSDKIHERQGAAIRLFLLINDNGTASYNLCYSILKESCQRKHGVTFERYLLSLNNDKSAIRAEVRHYVKQIKSYCYSIFTGQNDHSFIDIMNMNRVKAILAQEDYTAIPPNLGYEYTSRCFFEEYFCNYLLSEINMEKGLRTSRISSI